MNARRLFIVAGCLVVCCGATAAASGDFPRYSLSAATEYTTGTYGGDVDIEDIYVPLTGTVDLKRTSFRITVPYLSMRAPEGTTIVGPGGEPIPGPGELRTNSGLGDIIVSGTIYDVFHSRRLRLAVDLVGRAKFGTADVDDGLGTGENDYSARIDVLKFWEQFTLIGAIGYKFRGDTPDTDFDNVLTASVGGIYSFTPQLRGGLFLDYRESAISDNDSIQELSVFLSRRVSDDWRYQVYVMTGFTDSSLDWGGGIQVKRVLRNRPGD